VVLPVKKLINIQDIGQNFSKKFWQRSLVSGAAIAMLGAVTLPIVTGNGSALAQQISQKVTQQDQTQTRSQPVQMMQAGNFNFPLWVWVIGGVVIVFIFLPQMGWILGLIVVGEILTERRLTTWTTSCPQWRSWLSSGHPRPRMALWLLPLAIWHSQGICNRGSSG
jgi:hypothetical protein